MLRLLITDAFLVCIYHLLLRCICVELLAVYEVLHEGREAAWVLLMVECSLLLLN
jgi:hypothetical protein